MAGKLRAPSLQSLHDIFDFSPEPVSEAEVQAGMPQFSEPPADSVYKPINMPVDRDVGLQDLPPGFVITEEGVRDPQGKPAKFRSPSVGQVLSKLGTDILPVAGGALPSLARGAIGAANGVDKLANGFTTGPITAGAAAAGTLATLGQDEQPAKPEFNDFVARVRREAKEAQPAKKRPEQKPSPAILGIRG